MRISTKAYDEPIRSATVDGSKGIVEIIKSPPEIESAESQSYNEEIDRGRIFKGHIYLSDEEERMLAGDYGEGVKKCIDYLIKLGKAFGAKRMVPIASRREVVRSNSSEGLLISTVEFYVT